MSPVSRGFRGRGRIPAGEEDRVPPGQYVTKDFPVLSAGPTPHTPLPEWTFSITQGSDTLKSWTWQEMQALPAETVTTGHPLRHPLVQGRRPVAGRAGGHAAGPGGSRRPLRAGVLRRRLHHQPADRGRHRRQGVGGLRLRRRAARTRARRPGPAARAAPVLLEERQVDARPGTARLRRARVWETYGSTGAPHEESMSMGTPDQEPDVDGHAGPGVDVDGHAGRLTARRFAYQTDMARRGIHGLGSKPEISEPRRPSWHRY